MICYGSFLMNLAGIPPHNSFEGIVILATAEAAIIAHLPTDTPFKIVTLEANQTFSSMQIESVINSFC